MKLSNPRNISLFTSIVITIVTLIIYTISSILLYNEIHFLVLLAFIVILIPLSYFVLNKLLNTFIWNKIKLIYKNIHNLKVPKKSNEKTNNQIDKDIIEKVNQQVIEWSRDKSLEIDQLKKMEAYRREFIGNLSHELKTPIFNIQGYVLTLIDGGLDDPSINKEYLLRTEKSIDRMINIINDLDAIAKLESGELMLNFIKFDIFDLTNEVLDFLEIKAKEKNTKLYISSKAVKPVFVFADRESIKQVLINLIDNSLKYGIQDGKTKISFYDMDENILIEVADNGNGINKEEINRVFERFYRSERARSLHHSGSGLGLAIVKHIIEAHNQTINVRSTVNVGTTFSFTLKKAQ